MRHFFGFLTILTLISATACSGNTNSTAKIVGGADANGNATSAEATALSSVVALTYAESTTFCSGVLIAPNLLLTAAHCIPAAWVIPNPSDYRVSFGNDVKTNKGRLYITSALTHPNYISPPDFKTDRENFDVAIIEFQGTLPSGFHPATMQKPTTFSPPSKVMIAGYGFVNVQDAQGAMATSGILRYAQVPYKRYLDAKRDHELGKDGLPVGSCNGDSGGPAFNATPEGYKLIGLTSGGNCESDSVYTDIMAYKDWIEKASGIDVLTGKRVSESDFTQGKVTSFVLPSDAPTTGSNSGAGSCPINLDGDIQTCDAPRPTPTSTPDGSAGAVCRISATGVHQCDIPRDSNTGSTPIQAPPTNPGVGVAGYAAGLIGQSLTLEARGLQICVQFISSDTCFVKFKNGGNAADLAGLSAKCSVSGGEKTPSVVCSGAPGGACAGAGTALSRVALAAPVVGNESSAGKTLMGADLLTSWVVHPNNYCATSF